MELDFITMVRTKFIVLLLLVMALAMVFVTLNPQPVTIELALVHWQPRLGLALVIAFAMGLAIGALSRGAWVTELLQERGRLRRALKAAEAKVRGYAAGSERVPPTD
jgi:uncharacterized membrane protein YciS (DUF1049 family)